MRQLRVRLCRRIGGTVHLRRGLRVHEDLSLREWLRVRGFHPVNATCH